MEMGRSGNGGGKVVSFDGDAINGRRRNGSSLSSYLDMGRDADDGVRAATRPLPSPAHAMASRRRTYADGELDVFAAERYFKGAMDGDGDHRKEGFGVSVTAPAVAVQVQMQQPLVETTAARPAPEAVVMAKPSWTRASTAASSASSANSQTALVRARRRRSSRDNNRCCVQVGVLMRTCSGKRSVRVDGCAAAKEAPGTAAEPAAAATGIDWYRELRMHKAGLGLSGDGNYSHGLVAPGRLPPSLNLGTAKVAAIGREVTMTTGEEKEAAELTFSSSTRRRSNFTLVAPVRASMPASGGRVGEPNGGAAKCVGRDAHHLHDDDDDDAGSDSSSDLFEIKSLMIGDSPYEPSEASIQWSVVTADASERGGDRVSAATRWVGGGVGGARGPVAGSKQLRGHHTRPGGILAGCASHRAVDVSAPTTMKAVPSAAAAALQQRRSEGFHKARNGA